MDRFGIEAQPDAVFAAKLLEGIEEWLGDNTLAIVADDHCGAFGNHPSQGPDQTRGQVSVQAIAGFAVNADDLLFVGDDAGFDTGGARATGKQAATAN